MSTTMIVAAPTAFAASTAERPTAPPPKIAMLAPAGTFSEFITAPAPVWMPQPSGPRISSGASWGTFTALPSRAMASVAKEDCEKKFEVSVAPSASFTVSGPFGLMPMKFCSKNFWQ